MTGVNEKLRSEWAAVNAKFSHRKSVWDECTRTLLGLEAEYKEITSHIKTLTGIGDGASSRPLRRFIVELAAVLPTSDFDAARDLAPFDVAVFGLTLRLLRYGSVETSGFFSSPVKV